MAPELSRGFVVVFVDTLVPSFLEFNAEEPIHVLWWYVQFTTLRRHAGQILNGEPENIFQTTVTHAMPTSELRRF